MDLLTLAVLLAGGMVVYVGYVGKLDQGLANGPGIIVIEL